MLFPRHLLNRADIRSEVVCFSSLPQHIQVAKQIPLCDTEGVCRELADTERITYLLSLDLITVERNRFGRIFRAVRREQAWKDNTVGQPAVRLRPPAGQEYTIKQNVQNGPNWVHKQHDTKNPAVNRFIREQFVLSILDNLAPFRDYVPPRSASA